MSKTFIGQGKNVAFTCVNCGADVPPLANGSYRNHCPHCLHSIHIDINPGDRACECLGLLEPIGVTQHPKKGWIIISKCQTCHEIKRNKAALDDPLAPDDYDEIIRLSQNPLSL